MSEGIRCLCKLYFGWFELVLSGNGDNRIKSNGGDGYVRNILFDQFYGLGTAYGLDINEYWESTTGAGNGVTLSNITFSVSPSKCRIVVMPFNELKR